MITLTLKELNAAMPALKSAGESVVAGKIKYRLSRVLKSATDHLDDFGKSLAEMAQKHDAEMLGGGQFKFGEGQESNAIAFNKEADELMKSETVEIWGDPEFFPFDELEKACAKDKPINADTLSRLLFLISEPKEETA